MSPTYSTDKETLARCRRPLVHYRSVRLHTFSASRDSLTYCPPLKQHLPGPVVVEGEPQLDDVEADVLVEAVEDHLGDAGVVPRAVHQEQAGQVAELGDRKVGRIGGLGKRGKKVVRVWSQREI